MCKRVSARQVIRMVGESQETVSVGGGSGSSSNKMPTLEEYGTNLTTQATEVRQGRAWHLSMARQAFQQACQHYDTASMS